MMSLSKLIKKSPDQLLEQELSYFQEIVDQTQNLIQKTDPNSAESILRLLASRDYWIGEIKSHEILRKKFQAADNDKKQAYYLEKISDLAKALVVTDARLLDILQMQKIEIIKEIEKIVDIKSRSEQSRRRNQAPRIIDTVAM